MSNLLYCVRRRLLKVHRHSNNINSVLYFRHITYFFNEVMFPSFNNTPETWNQKFWSFYFEISVMCQDLFVCWPILKHNYGHIETFSYYHERNTFVFIFVMHLVTMLLSFSKMIWTISCFRLICHIYLFI